MFQALRIESRDTADCALILLHGLGSCAENWRAIAQTLAVPSTAEIILPQAPIQSVTLAGGEEAPAWFDLYGRDENSREDQTGITAAQQSLQQLVDSLKSRGIPPSRIVVGGFSQGGALALYYVCHHPELFAGVMGLSAYLPLRQLLEKTPTAKTPVFLSHGDHDDVIPVHFSTITGEILNQCGFPVTYRTYPLGHTLDGNVIADINSWLKDRF